MPTEDVQLLAACERLSELGELTRDQGPWASGAFAALADYHVLGRFIPVDCGGTGADEAAGLAVLTAVARHCVTTALAFSQLVTASRILAAAEQQQRQEFLDGHATGRRFSTIGISQLTTSRLLASRAPMVASLRDGWLLNGMCPWVTGADSADLIVTGAVVQGPDVQGPDGLAAAYFVVDPQTAGIDIEPPMRLVALSGSRTSTVRFHDVRPLAMIPAEAAGAPRAGGLVTSALTVGAALGSVDFLRRAAAESPDNADLAMVTDQLTRQCRAITDRLARPADIGPDGHEVLRSQANVLVVRATQAGLVAAKGSGFVEGHPAGRAVSEAQFFQVWSSPPGVTSRVLRGLAGEA